MNNMYMMNDTKQFFCVSEVLDHTTAEVQITYMLLESFCILGYRFIQVKSLFSESHLYIIFSFVLYPMMLKCVYTNEILFTLKHYHMTCQKNKIHNFIYIIY